MEPSIIQEIDGHVGILTFNRPNAMNAFNSELMGAATQAMADFSQNDRVRAIVVHGSGRCFSAGFDMKESAKRQTKGADAWREVLTYDFDFIMQFWNSAKPTISAVHGYCLGGAFELMLATDLSVAESSAVLGLPEPKFGSGSVAMLAPWVTGPKQAKELLLTGNDRMPPERCYDMGILNRVVEDGTALSTALELARQIVSCSPQSVQQTKKAIHQSYELAYMRQALQDALEIGVEIEADESPERIEFNRIRLRDGLKAALEWRDGKGS
jgi:enoyl-CoA hydratase